MERVAWQSPTVNIFQKRWKLTAFTGKTHQISVPIFNSYLRLPEGMLPSFWVMNELNGQISRAYSYTKFPEGMVFFDQRGK